MDDLASSVIGKKLKCGEYAYVEFLALLGTGASGAVYKVRRTILSPDAAKCDLLAAKVIDVRQLNLHHKWDREREKLRREVKILASLCHSGVVNLHGVIDTNDWLVLLMDLVDGGELFNKISSSGVFSEDQARYIFAQILLTIEFLHKNQIIHRDLKLENVLVDTEVAPGYYKVRVADFGLSKAIPVTLTVARSYVGTPQYWAPEVILAGRDSKSTYTFSADLWSLGCILFILIAGRYPFDCEYDWENEVLAGNYHMNDPVFSKISEECKAVIRGLLTCDPSQRLTIDDIKAMPWFGKEFPVPLPELCQQQRPPLHMNLGPLFIGADAKSMEVTEIPTLPLQQSPPPAAQRPPTPIIPDAKRQEGYRESVRQMFNATDMLELLVSVFYRFHQAYIVFRSNATVAASVQALLIDIKELTLSTRTTFQRIGLTCGTVIELLEDVRLCVEDGTPEAAVEMFENLQSWVDDVLEQGRTMREKHRIALERAVKLVQQTREMSGPNGSVSLLQLTLDEKAACFVEDQMSNTRPTPKDFLDASAEPHDLLDFLFVPGGGVGGVAAAAAGAADVGINAVEISATSSMGDGLSSPQSQAAPPPPTIDESQVVPSETAAAPTMPPSTTDLALNIPHPDPVTGEAAFPGSSLYVRQTALLLRGLQELQRVANMLEESTLYWDNLSAALSLVRKFRDQTSVLLRHAKGSQRQESRLLQRVSEYEAFWDELAKQTSTFVEGSRRSGESMRKFVNTFNESIVRSNALAEYYTSQQRQRQIT